MIIYIYENLDFLLQHKVIVKSIDRVKTSIDIFISKYIRLTIISITLIRLEDVINNMHLLMIAYDLSIGVFLKV